MKFAAYESAGFYDEMFCADGTPRSGARLLQARIEGLADGELLTRQAAAELLLLQYGITFNVYSDSAATEKIFPFDIIPRIVEAAEWDWIEKGLKQRVYALNLFIDDIYHKQKSSKTKSCRNISSNRPAPIERSVPASIRRKTFGAIFRVQTWCATVTVRCTFSKTICAALRACRTCSRIARS